MHPMVAVRDQPSKTLRILVEMSTLRQVRHEPLRLRNETAARKPTRCMITCVAWT